MDNKLQDQEWYQHLIGECRAIITEALFTSRWALVEGYWNLGKRIRDDINVKEFAKGNKTFVQDLGRNLGISESTIYYSLQAYDKYPDMNFPEGKNITWNKLVTKYLPEAKIELPIPPIPEGKFNTIVVDPPWPMEFMQLDMRPNQIEMPYPIMSIEQIKAIPIHEKASENCNLFLWTTHKFIKDAFDIMQGWGFDYHVLLTWDKTNGRSLFGFNRRTEFCLYGHNGNITVNQRGNFIDTIFTEKLREHSRKPVIFDDILRSNTPTPRLEWFSREVKEGFVSFGNEVGKYGVQPIINS